MKIDLSPIATKELIQELNRRTTLMQSNGLLSPDAFRLRAKLGAIVCTDGVPIRMHEGVLQAGLIRRNTGDYQGKLCLIGGVVALGETLDTALRRHFRTDIGKEISFLDSRGACCPCAAYQYYGDGRSNDF
ncbi:MAG: hypothetical protein U1A23_04270, partial [Candidatus Sungbacteria bacterium]|nr:hypothetical protein [Candidatus Sungbacteria bacterium]